jgi:AcrR family transcriptional regulator
MTHTPQPKRKYNSNRRQAQAGETRRQIMAAARRLFYARGYSGATIESIAQEAGVAPETIYSIFSNKQAILMSIVNQTIVGDDEPVALLQRPAIMAAQVETDQHRLIQNFAQGIYEIMSRMSPIFELLRAAARTDPEIASILEKLLNGRLEGMSYFVGQLNRIGPLRESITLDQAQVAAWAISSAEVFDLLTRDRTWSKDQYVAWLTDTLIRLILP